jgi:hypothetical protein
LKIRESQSKEFRTDKLDREILGALRTEAARTPDRWVAVSLSLLTSCCAYAEDDQQLVHRRLQHLRQVGLLSPETRSCAGLEVHGFIVSASRQENRRTRFARNNPSELLLTAFDRKFLHAVAIDPDGQDMRTPVERLRPVGIPPRGHHPLAGSCRMSGNGMQAGIEETAMAHQSESARQPYGDDSETVPA